MPHCLVAKWVWLLQILVKIECSVGFHWTVYSPDFTTPRTLTNTKWTLKVRPVAVFTEADASLETEDIDLTALAPEEVVIVTEVLSVDAFLRTMLDEEAYHGSIVLGGTLPAMGIGKVVAVGSAAKLSVGSKCIGLLGAQTVAKLVPGPMGPHKLVNFPGVQERASLGLLGLTTGITAWVGVNSVARPPRAGETVVVTVAAGAVGSIAAQLCLSAGARVIGVAGGVAKCAYLLDDLKLHGAVDYKSTTQTVDEQLATLCPNGVDFFYDNAGGAVLDCVLRQINGGGRVVICGAASQYNGNLNKGGVQGPSEYLKLAEKGASMTGFNVMQHMPSVAMAVPAMLWHHARGTVVLREQVEVGIASFPKAMEQMFTGGHIGRLLVDVRGRLEPH
jgi:hypothetical protein